MQNFNQSVAPIGGARHRLIYVISPFILEGLRFLGALEIVGFDAKSWLIIELLFLGVLIIFSVIRKVPFKKIIEYAGIYLAFLAGAFLLMMLVTIIGIGLGDAGL